MGSTERVRSLCLNGIRPAVKFLTTSMAAACPHAVNSSTFPGTGSGGGTYIGPSKRTRTEGLALAKSSSNVQSNQRPMVPTYPRIGRSPSRFIASADGSAFVSHAFRINDNLDSWRSNRRPNASEDMNIRETRDASSSTTDSMEHLERPV